MAKVQVRFAPEEQNWLFPDMSTGTVSTKISMSVNVRESLLAPQSESEQSRTEVSSRNDDLEVERRSNVTVNFVFSSNGQPDASS
jgi:hypothetical protein